MARPRDADWAEAKRLCRLSAEDIRMARELSLNPRKLIKNRPSPSQRWKLQVRDWVRKLYGKSHVGARPPGEVRPVRSPHLKQLPPDPDFTEDAFGDDRLESDESRRWDLEDEDRFRRRRQEEFRAAADYVAVAFAGMTPVERVALFGSVARPLEREQPRLRRVPRTGALLRHECKDVDLAVWVNDANDLKALQKVRSRALNDLLVDTGFGVAHHQVDVFLLEPGTDRYRGRLCCFGTCPKGKPECLVPDCGKALFLRQHEGFTLDPQALEPRSTILLFDRSRSFGPPSLGRWGEHIPF